MQRIDCMRVLFWIILLLPTLCCGSLEVTFLDVGQGNCTLVGSREIGEVLPLLVDCGSNSYKFKETSSFLKEEDRSFRDAKIEYLYKKIISLLKNASFKKISIVISHPDTDHYNWIEALVSKCLAAKIEITSLYLGGSEEAYSSKFKKFLVKLKSRYKDGFSIVDQMQLLGNKDPTIVFKNDEGGVKYELLLPLPYKKKDDANDASLVVRVTYKGKSCLLTGDATKKTGEYNFECLPDLKADILQASHHGAESEGCNNENWVKKLNPSFAMISSGFHGHRHPRTIIVSRFLNLLPKVKCGHHPVYVGIKNASDSLSLKSFVKSFVKNSEGYGIISTEQGLYGTLGQGDITFDLGAVGVPTCFVEASYEDARNCTMMTLINPAYKEFRIEFLKVINLSDLGLDDSDGSLREFIGELIKRADLLKKLILNNNKITGKEVLGLLLELLKARLHIRVFEIADNGLAVDQQVLFKKVWDNRGLKLE